MKQTFKIVLGLAMIATGVLWILNISGVLNFSFSLDGWWTLFIIVPCLGALIEGPDRVGASIGLSIGIILLLCARDIIEWHNFWQFALAVLVIGIGLKLIFYNNNQCSVQELKTISRNGKDIKSIELNFGKQALNYSGERFEGLDVKLAFGNVDVDLRNAVIDSDVEIRLDVAFAGMTIYVPQGYVVKQAVNCAAAGVKDNRASRVLPDCGPVIYISGRISFGGVEII